jgi:hypothetical protein
MNVGIDLAPGRKFADPETGMDRPRGRVVDEGPAAQPPAPGAVHLRDLIVGVLGPMDDVSVHP